MINFSKSEFYYDPFPHAVLKDVFDLNFYQNLCEEFPSEEKFERHDFDKKNKLKQKKMLINHDSKNFLKIINKNSNLEKLYNFLLNKNFSDKILNLLSENYINLKPFKNNNSFFKNFYNQLMNKKKCGFEFSMISTDGGFIKPHTDGADKLVSFVIPIIENEIISKVENSGTSILNTDSDMYKFNFFNQTVPEEYVNKVKEIGFEKNQIFLFVKTHNSLHSVGPMKNINGQTMMRKSINFFIYK